MSISIIQTDSHDSAFPDYARLRIYLHIFNRLPLDRGWNAENVRSPYWRICRNADPGASVRFGDNRLPLKPHHVYLIPAWVTFTCCNTAMVLHSYAHFELMGIPPALVRTCFPRPIRVPGSSAAEAAFHALPATSDQSMAGECRVRAWIETVLADLFASLTPVTVKMLQSPF